MIVFGIRAKIIAAYLLNITCSKCGNSKHIFHVVQKYLHIFWIPTLPISAYAVAECQHCRAVIREEDASGELKKSFSKAVKTSKIPTWMFSGLALIVILFGILTYTTHRDDKITKEFFAHPKYGDIYLIKNSKNDFQFAKLESFTESEMNLKLGTIVYTDAEYAKNDVKNQLKKSGTDYFLNQEIVADRFKLSKVVYSVIRLNEK